MKIVAVDTSTEACSAALWLDGVVSGRFEIAPRGHSRLILPMLDSLFREAGLQLAQMNAVAFGCGPGSFTGVRIAAGIAQGLAFGADLPVVPVSSLAALAQGANEEYVLAAIDARMGEVYWGAYTRADSGLMCLHGSEGVYPPQEVPQPDAGVWIGAGTGWGVYASELQQRLAGAVSTYDAERYPQASDVARLAVELFQRGSIVSAEHALPVYVRNDVAWKKQNA